MEINNIFPTEGNVAACGSDDHQMCNPDSQKKYSLIMSNSSDVINTPVTKFSTGSVHLQKVIQWSWSEKKIDTLPKRIYLSGFSKRKVINCRSTVLM